MKLVIALLFSLLFAVGCSTLSKPPKLSVKTKTGTEFKQTGETKTPATVESNSSVASVDLPANSTVTVTQATASEPAKISVSLAAPSVLNADFKTEKITGPKSVEPTSQTEIAKGKAVQWFYIASLAFGVASLAFLYLQHYKAAGFAAIGAVGLPMLGQFVSSDKALIFAVVCGCVSLTLFGAWFILKRKFPVIDSASTNPS